MNEKNILTASSENYLKAVYSIVKENKAARVKDVSKLLNIGASSVSEALRILADKQLINYQPYGIITMSEAGEKIAKELCNRHEIIIDFLENVLLVDKESVDENANKIEYGVSSEVLTKFVRFLEFMATCSCKEPKWIQSYKHYVQEGELKDKCKQCVATCSCSSGRHSNKNCCGVPEK